MILYAGKQGGHRHKNRLLDSVGEGKGGMIWENSIETCTLSFVKQMTSASSIHETGHPKPVLWGNPEGYSSEGVGKVVQAWVGTCIPVAD